MAQLIGYPGGYAQGDTTAVDTTQQAPLLTRGYDAAGFEYIYLKGVASTAAGSVVVYDEAGVTTLIAANAIGPVAVAQAVVDAATKFGWYGVKGSFSAACDAGIVDNSKVYIDGTSGRVDDTVVAGDQIMGAVFRSTDSGNFATIQINEPYASDSLG